MGLRFILIAAVATGFSFSVPAQSFTIRAPHNYLAADALGNSYLVNHEELLKFSSNGTLAARYSNLRLGDIASIDATNPLKLLLFYRDFQQIVFLDDLLSAAGEPLALQSLGFEQTDLACAASNNGFWIFSKQNNEIVRFDEKGKKLFSTGNLKQLLPESLAPSFMAEHSNMLYLCCPENGIYVFDSFGAFSRKISLKGLEMFDMQGDVIYFKKATELCSFSLSRFQEGCKNVSQTEPVSIRYSTGRIFTSYRDSVVVTGM